MRALKRILLPFGLFGLAVGVSLTLDGCSRQTPTAPETVTVAPQSTQSNLEFIAFGEPSSGLQKVVTVSKWITREKGGQLKLKYRDEVKLNVRLKIRPFTMSEDAEVSLSLDDAQLSGSIDLTFEPDGITFDRPALLTLYAKGLDLDDDLDPDKIDIYYFNDDTGQWENVPRKWVYVNLRKGMIFVLDAEIPHFSRYAVAHSQ